MSRKGWLQNPERRARRDKPNSFTDRDCSHLIKQIEKASEYVSATLGPEVDRLVRLRDRALISATWIFFKRAGEVLAVKRKDVSVAGKELLITFHLQKKQKRHKVCRECDAKNGYRSNFCRRCNADLKKASVRLVGEPQIVTKRKTLQHQFTRYITEWLEEFDMLTKDQESWFFPSLRVVFTTAFFDFKSAKPMSVQNFNRILKRLDPSMTSCLFRYGGTEKYLLLGYLPHELKEIGDWSSSKMPEVYAERKGITPVQRRWSEDIR